MESRQKSHRLMRAARTIRPLRVAAQGVARKIVLLLHCSSSATATGTKPGPRNFVASLMVTAANHPPCRRAGPADGLLLHKGFAAAWSEAAAQGEAGFECNARPRAPESALDDWKQEKNMERSKPAWLLFSAALVSGGLAAFSGLAF
ncbi:MAG TPA: hypothetical protein VHI52_06910, partial [Verrucomicrobiae bacterium]|nr:hypothetical protein [Verrucomicrobiae bacterium]